MFINSGTAVCIRKASSYWAIRVLISGSPSDSAAIWFSSATPSSISRRTSERWKSSPIVVALEPQTLANPARFRRFSQRALPVLSTFGDPVRLLGPLGSGQLAKLVNNLLFTAGLTIDVRRLFDEIFAVLLMAIVAVLVCIAGVAAADERRQAPRPGLAAAGKSFCARNFAGEN